MKDAVRRDPLGLGWYLLTNKPRPFIDCGPYVKSLRAGYRYAYGFISWRGALRAVDTEVTR